MIGMKSLDFKIIIIARTIIASAFYIACNISLFFLSLTAILPIGFFLEGGTGGVDLPTNIFASSIPIVMQFDFNCEGLG